MSATTKPTRFAAAATNGHLDIWGRNEQTDVYVSEGSDNLVLKDFSRSGGFKGKSANATYIVKRLTAEFGPIGTGWGYNIAKEEMLQGAPIMKEGAIICHEIIHMLRIEFWYRGKDGAIQSFQQFGQTAFVTGTKYGAFTDEEAPKKSLTDAVTKAAAWLGFAADVHMGMWDDNKYISDSKASAETERAASLRAQQLAKPYCFINAKGDIFTEKGAAVWQEDWFKRIKALVAVDKLDVLRDAWKVNAEAVASTRLVDPDIVADVERQIAIALGEASPADIRSAAQAEAEQQQNAGAEEGTSEKREEGSAEDAGKYPPDPPDAFAIVGTDEDRTVHQITRNARGVRAEEIWLATWKRAVGGAPSADDLRRWHGMNAEHLALMRHYHPTIAVLADLAFNERIDALDKKGQKNQATRREQAPAK